MLVLERANDEFNHTVGARVGTRGACWRAQTHTHSFPSAGCSPHG